MRMGAGCRVQGRHTVDLTWSPVTSAYTDIYRDGVVIATVPNTGAYKDFIGVRGGNARYIYKVCDAGNTGLLQPSHGEVRRSAAVTDFGRASRQCRERAQINRNQRGQRPRLQPSPGLMLNPG